MWGRFSYLLQGAVSERFKLELADVFLLSWEFRSLCGTAHLCGLKVMSFWANWFFLETSVLIHRDVHEGWTLLRVNGGRWDLFISVFLLLESFTSESLRMDWSSLSERCGKKYIYKYFIFFTEKATDGSLQSEDWTLNMEICDIINETEEGYALFQQTSKGSWAKSPPVAFSVWGGAVSLGAGACSSNAVYLQIGFPSPSTFQRSPVKSSTLYAICLPGKAGMKKCLLGEGNKFVLRGFLVSADAPQSFDITNFSCLNREASLMHLLQHQTSCASCSLQESPWLMLHWALFWELVSLSCLINVLLFWWPQALLWP